MKKEQDSYPVWIILLIILGVIIWSVFDSSPPLPPNCHRTPSVDVGGSEIECD